MPACGLFDEKSGFLEERIGEDSFSGAVPVMNGLVTVESAAVVTPSVRISPEEGLLHGAVDLSRIERLSPWGAGDERSHVAEGRKRRKKLRNRKPVRCRHAELFAVEH
jgi:hypothetical protein